MENSTRCACISSEGEVRGMSEFRTCDQCGSTAIIFDDTLKRYKCIDCGYKFENSLD